MWQIYAKPDQMNLHSGFFLWVCARDFDHPMLETGYRGYGGPIDSPLVPLDADTSTADPILDRLKDGYMLVMNKKTFCPNEFSAMLNEHPWRKRHLKKWEKRFLYGLIDCHRKHWQEVEWLQEARDTVKRQTTVSRLEAMLRRMGKDGGFHSKE